MSILLRVAYDGTGFSGWARQKPRLDGTPIRTVQGELEAALSRLYRAPVSIRGASRTDAGVHARGQLVSFKPPTAGGSPASIPPRGVLEALSGRLPRDVTVVAAWRDDTDPDVRGGNGGKHYRYRVRTTRARDPVGGHDEWQLGRPLDIDAMRRAAAAFAGHHDFSAFRSAGCQAASTTRTVHEVRLTSTRAPLGPQSDEGRFDAETDPIRGPDAGAQAGVVTVDVDGQAFLQHMVRIMVGTLVEIGRGRMPVERVAELVRGAHRRDAGPTAPACGLTLVEVRWPASAPGL